MNILYVTSEAVPFCKTGGLADVAGSLPQSLAANGDRVSVILPLYQSVADAWRDRLHFERYTYVRLAWRSLYCGLFSYERQGVTWYFVDNEQYFKRPELYGYYDDGERFAFFCRAVTELLPLLPDGFHVLTVRLAEDGVCHLNLPAADLELLPEGESAQLRMFRGIVRSLCSLDEVTSVQVLVDGEMRTSFGAVDISQPLRP